MTTQHREAQQLPEYLTGRLPADAEARVKAHLEGCLDCRRLAAELEVGLAALAIARDEPASDDVVVPPAAPGSTAPAARRSRGRLVVGLVAAACAVLLVGGAAGVALERRNAGPEVLATFVLDPDSVLEAAAGTADLSLVDAGLQIGLDLDALPTDAQYFECLWIDATGTEVRSAGTFVTSDGSAHVDLVVAPFAPGEGWTLEVNAMADGERVRTVLSASV